MKTVYMNKDGEISVTRTKYEGGVEVEVINEDYLLLSEQEIEERVDQIVKEIEGAAQIRGIKKFAVGKSFWSATPPEYIINRVTKAVELAELKGYRFVGGITISDRPVGGDQIDEPKKSSSFKRWCFIEFEEAVNPQKKEIESVETLTTSSWYKPWTWLTNNRKVNIYE